MNTIAKTDLLATAARIAWDAEIAAVNEYCDSVRLDRPDWADIGAFERVVVEHDAVFIIKSLEGDLFSMWDAPINTYQSRKMKRRIRQGEIAAVRGFCEAHDVEEPDWKRMNGTKLQFFYDIDDGLIYRMALAHYGRHGWIVRWTPAVSPII